MCLAQGPQRSDTGEARTRGPSVSSQALYHWATALPTIASDQYAYYFWSTILHVDSDISLAVSTRMSYCPILTFEDGST